MAKTIAWAHMVELDAGLTKEETSKLLNLVPEDVDVVPFTSDIDGRLESNSIAYGFLDNDHYDSLSEVQDVLISICNDWSNERQDKTYLLKNGHQIVML